MADPYLRPHREAVLFCVIAPELLGSRAGQDFEKNRRGCICTPIIWLESQKFSTIKLPMSLCRLQGLFGAVELNAVCCFRWVSPTLHKYDDAGNA